MTKEKMIKILQEYNYFPSDAIFDYAIPKSTWDICDPQKCIFYYGTSNMKLEGSLMNIHAIYENVQWVIIANEIKKLHEIEPELTMSECKEFILDSFLV